MANVKLSKNLSIEMWQLLFNMINRKQALRHYKKSSI